MMACKVPNCCGNPAGGRSVCLMQLCAGRSLLASAAAAPKAAGLSALRQLDGNPQAARFRSDSQRRQL
jgi:hypothetical protein